MRNVGDDIGDEIGDAALVDAVEDNGEGDDIGEGDDQPWAWHAVRVSGLFLAGLIVWQFVMTFVVNDIGTTTAATMSTRWRDSTWRTIEWVTLFLALAHGGLAIVRTFNASQRSPRARRLGTVLTSSLTLGLMAAVSVVALKLR